MTSAKKDVQKKKEKKEKREAVSAREKALYEQARKRDVGRSRRVKVTGRQLFTHLLLAIAAFSAILAFIWVQQPVVWTVGTQGGLTGESQTDSPEQARAFAEASIQEAKSLWAEPASNWRVMVEPEQTPLTVECRSVTEGVNQSPKNAVARAEGIFRGVTADQVFEFLTSPEGLALIDPIGGNRTDFYQVIEKIPSWSEDVTAELAEIKIPFPGPFFSPRHFLVQSTTVPAERIFVAKSVVHKLRPGASAYYKGDAGTSENSVRAVTTFAIKVETQTSSSDGKEEVLVKMISHVNMFLLEGIMSYISCKWLFPDLFQVLHKAFGDEEEIKQDTSKVMPEQDGAESEF